MALLPPVAKSTLTQHFCNQNNLLEFPYYHDGCETAMFGWYTGATRSVHFHAGTDFAAPYGTPLVASEAGTVLWASLAANPGAFAGGGNVVTIRTDGGMQFTNCHMATFAVSVGQKVTRGQKIGTMGSTGISTGPHTHFALSTKSSSGSSKFYNPEYFLPGGKYADSPLIKSATSEDDMLQWVNGIKPVTSPPTIKKVTLKAGQPIRSSPDLSGGNVTNTLTAATVLNVHGKVAGDSYLGSTTWFVYSLNGGGLRVFHSKQI